LTSEEETVGEEVRIDSKPQSPIRPFTIKDRLELGGVALVCGGCQPSDGLRVCSSRVTAAIHEGDTVKMEWRAASDRLRSHEIVRDNAHVVDARLPFWVRSQAMMPFFAISMDAAFIKQIWETDFGQAAEFELRTAIGVQDQVIERIGLLGQKELSEGGIGGRLYAEGLGTALAVHLLRQYGTSPRAQVICKGGIASRPLQRVIEYVNENLEEALSLAQLATIAKLSPHHFATAFKASTGRSPYRYVIERRLDRARELLRRNENSISEIAHTVGFSSHSHLTAHFRRTMGLTPRAFRRSLN
jgi:AraC family transcriptional regulator